MPCKFNLIFLGGAKTEATKPKRHNYTEDPLLMELNREDVNKGRVCFSFSESNSLVEKHSEAVPRQNEHKVVRLWHLKSAQETC